MGTITNTRAQLKRAMYRAQRVGDFDTFATLAAAYKLAAS